MKSVSSSYQSRSCGIIVLAPETTGEEVNAQVWATSAFLFYLSAEEQIASDFLERAGKTVSLSRVTGVCVTRSGEHLMVTREVIESLQGFSANHMGIEIIREFVERVKSTRLCNLVSMATDAHAEKERVSSSEKPLEVNDVSELHFRTENFNFHCSMLVSNEMETAPQLVDEQQVAIMSQAAQHFLNSEANTEALRLLDEILQANSSKTDAIFAKAIAEARLGLYEDTLQTLAAFLEHDSSHEEARELFERLKVMLTSR